MTTTRTKRESKTEQSSTDSSSAKRQKTETENSTNSTSTGLAPIDKSSDNETDSAAHDVAAEEHKEASSSDILTYLLLDSTLDSISPSEILESGCEDDLRYPHSTLPPFPSLVSALLLSKPFSHRLGMRAIHQVFKDPYRFTTPKAVLEAGGETRWQALVDAHTLHKDKTSGQLRELARHIKEKYPDDYDGSDLKQFRASAAGDVVALERQVCALDGFARKTTSVFFRRVQVHWPELFPYADDLAIEAAREMGLQVETAEDLLTLVRQHIGQKTSIDDGDRAEGEEERQKKALREKYVRVLDVMIGKKLDKDIESAKEEAAHVQGAAGGEDGDAAADDDGNKNGKAEKV